MYDALKRTAADTVRRGDRDAPPQRTVIGVRFEACVEHAKRSEDVSIREVVERHAGDALDDQLEQYHVPIAIHGLRAWRRLQRTLVDLREVLGPSASLAVERRVCLH